MLRWPVLSLMVPAVWLGAHRIVDACGAERPCRIGDEVGSATDLTGGRETPVDGRAGPDPAGRSERVDIAVEVAGLVDEVSYRHFLDDLLYTHDGDNRGFGPQHIQARDNITATFESFGLFIEWHAFAFLGLDYHNVVATQMGSLYPQEQIIVCAHYDSADTPGADDNGSGVAGMLEIARVLAQYETACTVKYIAFDKEELGPLGSDAYVQDHLDDNILAVINLDMIAFRQDEYAVMISCSAFAESLQLALAEAVTEHGGGLLSPVITTQNIGSDHLAFAEDDRFKACLLIESELWTNACFHEPCDSVDTPDYIDYDFASDITRSVAAFLAGEAGVHHPGDCNNDGIPDDDQIQADPDLDCIGNGVLDECEHDCNENGSADTCDIADATSADCTGNGIPDECEPDCNGNGVADSCDIAGGTSEDCDGDGAPDECETYHDCNGNGVRDRCDIAAGTSPDCDRDGRPDECENHDDCNGNGVADECDIAVGDSADCSVVLHDCCLAHAPQDGPGCSDPAVEAFVCNEYPSCCEVEWHYRCALTVLRHCGGCDGAEGNGVPDECEPDCNDNGVADSCDIADRTSEDCRLLAHDCCEAGLGPGCTDPAIEACVCNYHPDLAYCCETQWDCRCAKAVQPLCGDCGYGGGDGVPDECEPDCNNNGAADSCDVAGGVSADCNGNGTLDECDLADASSQDDDGDGVPDECEGVPPAPEPGGSTCSVAGDCMGAWLGADCVDGTCYIPKNRYLTIDPTTNEYEVAYQVEVIDAADYPASVGRTWWVDVPVCYDYPNGAPVVPTPLMCEGSDRFGWISRLTSDPVTRWWTEDLLHVTGCGIAPAVVYAVRASGNGGLDFSEELQINTAHNPDGDAQNWGDVTGGPVPGMPGRWLAPERATNFADVGYAIRTFENRSGDTGFPPRVWIDVEGNQVINLADIQFIVNAFEGMEYAQINLPLIGMDPADCP